MIKQKKSFTLILLFVLTSISSFSQVVNYSTKISVSVSADVAIKNQLESSLLKKFRTFDDVKVVSDEFATYQVSIIAMETLSKDGYSFGYVSSVSVNSFIRTKDIIQAIVDLSLTKDEFGEESFQEFIERRNDLRTLLDSSYVGSTIEFYTSNAKNIDYSFLILDSEIESLAERIVATIDVEVFEKGRQFFESMNSNNY